MGGDGHNDSCAVTGYDIVGGPDRNLLAGDRMNRIRSGEDAGLFARRRHAVDIGCLFREFLIFGHSLAAFFGRQLIAEL